MLSYLRIQAAGTSPPLLLCSFLLTLSRTLEAYCEEYVMRMGVDAEGPLVDMGILFSLLQSKGTLVMFDRRYHHHELNASPASY
jgi:hypothetical protein